ncbi:MAG: hypothetical protein ACM3WT_03485, partial [Bacillota bacterium]
MRIAYLVLDDLNTMPGVRGKILEQVNEWRLRGHETTVFAAGPADTTGRVKNLTAIYDSRVTSHLARAAAYVRRSSAAY